MKRSYDTATHDSRRKQPAFGDSDQARKASTKHFSQTLRSSASYGFCMDYQPVVVKRHARPSSKHNPESRYWRQFKHPVFVKEYAPITSIHFSPSKPHRFAVTAATRIQIYAPHTQKVIKTISRFKDVARCGHIRSDGKLIVAGDDSGLVQVRIRERAIVPVSHTHNVDI